MTATCLHMTATQYSSQLSRKCAPVDITWKRLLTNNRTSPICTCELHISCPEISPPPKKACEADSIISITTHTCRADTRQSLPKVASFQGSSLGSHFPFSPIPYRIVCSDIYCCNQDIHSWWHSQYIYANGFTVQKLTLTCESLAVCKLRFAAIAPSHKSVNRIAVNRWWWTGTRTQFTTAIYIVHACEGGRGSESRVSNGKVAALISIMRYHCSAFGQIEVHEACNCTDFLLPSFIRISVAASFVRSSVLRLCQVSPTPTSNSLR